MKNLQDPQVMAKQESAFIGFVVLPYWNIFNQFLNGELQEAVDNLNENKKIWDEKLIKEEPKSEDLKKLQPIEEEKITEPKKEKYNLVNRIKNFDQLKSKSEDLTEITAEVKSEKKVMTKEEFLKILNSRKSIKDGREKIRKSISVVPDKKRFMKKL